MLRTILKMVLLLGILSATTVCAVPPPLPDFVITSMSISPTNAVEGTPVEVTVTVKNQGQVAGDGRYLDIWYNATNRTPVVGDVGDWWASVGSLEAGESRTLTAPPHLVDNFGTNQLFVCIEFEDLVSEVSNTNNCRTLSYDVASVYSLLSPVYRFWSFSNRAHFFTQSEAEKDSLIANSSQSWRYEDIAYHAFCGPTAYTVPVYRFWSTRYHGHFYTISEVEKNNLVANSSSGWRYEGVAYHVYSSFVPNSVPVYRFWSPLYKHHFFTISEVEKDRLVADSTTSWDYEQIAYYVPLAPVETVLISFDAQGGEPSVPLSKRVTYGSAYGPLAVTARAGYVFDGWWTGPEGTGTEVTASTTVRSVVPQTLYAKWTAASFFLSPVYRFWSFNNRAHFFTQSEPEKDHLVANSSENWRYEGIAYHAFSRSTGYTVPVYRFWSTRYHGHFYTISEEEKNNLVANSSSSWRYEGMAYHVYSSFVPDSMPVYRFWSPLYKHHFFTISEVEKNHLIDNSSTNWNYEGIAFYVPTVLSQSFLASTFLGTKAFDNKNVVASETLLEPQTAFEDSGIPGRTEKKDFSRAVALAVADGIDMVYPLTYLDGMVTAYVYDSVTEQWTCVLSATDSPASVVLENVQPDRSYLLDVFAGDLDGEMVSVYQSSFAYQFDPPEVIHEDSDAVDQENDGGVGRPIVRIKTPIVDGLLTVKLYSASQGVLETLVNVSGGEMVELAIPEWNCWYWISGWSDAGNELVLSIWLRQERE